MELEAIAYTSTAVGHPTDAELHDLLVKARAQNELNGVTGVLLYHDGSFFQYFEGPPRGMEVVYERIRIAPMHRGIIELMRAPVKERAFSEWLMGFTRTPGSEILQLENASWHARVMQHEESPTNSDGFQLLYHFWRTYRPVR